jgi:hypothetical protein
MVGFGECGSGETGESPYGGHTKPAKPLRGQRRTVNGTVLPTLQDREQAPYGGIQTAVLNSPLPEAQRAGSIGASPEAP